MTAVGGYDQARVDRLCQAVAWATANEQTFGRLTRMSVEESGMGSADGVPATSCLPSRARFSAAGLGGKLRLGDTAESALFRAGQPSS